MVSVYIFFGHCCSYKWQTVQLSGFTRLQASTEFACMGENVTFSCTSSYSSLIWDVRFADQTIRPVIRLFLIGDTPGTLFTKSIATHGIHLYFQMISNNNGVLDSILTMPTSANALENAVIECEGSEIRRLIFRLACKCYK